MHDIKQFIEETEFIKKNILSRGINPAIIDEVIALNETRKKQITEVESFRAQVKNLSKECGLFKKDKNEEQFQETMKKVAIVKTSIDKLESLLKSVEIDIEKILAGIPNIVADDVPYGKTENDNVELNCWGEKQKFDFPPLEHTDLGENLGLLDFERGAKLTGARFVVYKGAIARLERALINYMLDEHLKHGYQEIIPPFIVNDDSVYGTGQLPKFEDDLFKLNLPEKNWYLIPTAEVPLTNLKRGELFSGDELPLKYVAYSPCFRSEAGSHGKDTKGLIRLHQFNKVEMVNIVAAEDSEQAHSDMINRATSILEALKLPYRSILLCTADIGFGSRKCVDLEVWLPGQNKYREISSISNCWDFQSRRASIRYRNKAGKPTYAHTLNGSGLAVGRTVVAIMENYQLKDGSISIPEVLRPYMGGLELIA